jgi:hypothetical protein
MCSVLRAPSRAAPAGRPADLGQRPQTVPVWSGNSTELLYQASCLVAACQAAHRPGSVIQPKAIEIGRLKAGLGSGSGSGSRGRGRALAGGGGGGVGLPPPAACRMLLQNGMLWLREIITSPLLSSLRHLFFVFLLFPSSPPALSLSRFMNTHTHNGQGRRDTHYRRQ